MITLKLCLLFCCIVLRVSISTPDSMHVRMSLNSFQVDMFTCFCTVAKILLFAPTNSGLLHIVLLRLNIIWSLSLHLLTCFLLCYSECVSWCVTCRARRVECRVGRGFLLCEVWGRGRMMKGSFCWYPLPLSLWTLLTCRFIAHTILRCFNIAGLVF